MKSTRFVRMKYLTRSIASDRNLVCLCLLLLSADCAFLGLHSLKGWIPLLDVSWLHIESSSGLAERFQHLKELTIVALLVVIAWRRGGLAYWSWALLFAYVFCDDVFKLHQNVGQHLSEIVELANPMMGSQIMAELLVSFVAGSCLFSVIGVTYAVGSEVFRAFSRDLILLFSLFAFFGIVVDLIPALCHLNHVITFMMVGIEEVGELLAMSLIVIYACGVSILDPVGDLRGVPKSLDVYGTS
jgi:hypothetical protein